MVVQLKTREAVRTWRLVVKVSLSLHAYNVIPDMIGRLDQMN